jgi:hypothetical protein
MLDEDLELDIDLEISECPYCNKLDTDHLREHVQGIVEAVYVSGDVMKLESCLDEVCYELGVNINQGIPAIQKKKTFDLMQQHLGYQRAMIDNQRGRL